jgi:hypothetical protein
MKNYEYIGDWELANTEEGGWHPGNLITYAKGPWRIQISASHGRALSPWWVSYGQRQVAAFRQWSEARRAVETGDLDSPLRIVDLEELNACKNDIGTEWGSV